MTRTMFTVAATAFLAAIAAHAQTSHEERAKMILQMFEAGEEDSAYVLVEGLKADRNARFVPAVLYTRAQMTPDDRALDLYREIIALEAGGSYADDAAYQLVRRYIEKGDSIAAGVWFNVLKGSYPRSAYVGQAEESLKTIKEWKAKADPPASTTSGRTASATPGRPTGAVKTSGGTTTVPAKSTPSKGTAPSTKPAATTKTTPAAKTEPARGKTTPSTKSGGASADTKSDTKTTGKSKTTTPENGALKGYALQVGIFPTKQAAESRMDELTGTKFRMYTLPKFIDGKKQFALVVGLYSSIDEANTKKSDVSAACDCQAFVVKVD